LPNGPVLFCTQPSVVVVCNVSGLPADAGQGTWQVWLRPVRVTPC